MDDTTSRWGTTVTVETSLGPIDCRTAGDGPPVLFVHGFVVDGRLWDGVAPAVAETHRVVVPDLPLGAHRRPVPDRSRLSTTGVPDALVELMDGLGIEAATVVGNDTGGGLSQVLVSRHPDRVARLALVSCDAYRNFPPPLFRPLVHVPGLPGALTTLARLLGSSRHQRRWLPLGFVAEHPLDDALLRSWAEPILTDEAIRADARAFLRTVRPRVTLDAATSFPSFPRPVLIAWATGDRLFPAKDARRLADDFPDGRLVWIDDSGTLAPIDQPTGTTTVLTEFLTTTSPGDVSVEARGR